MELFESFYLFETLNLNFLKNIRFDLQKHQSQKGLLGESLKNMGYFEIIAKIISKQQSRKVNPGSKEYLSFYVDIFGFRNIYFAEEETLLKTQIMTCMQDYKDSHELMNSFPEEKRLRIIRNMLEIYLALLYHSVFAIVFEAGIMNYMIRWHYSHQTFTIPIQTKVLKIY